MILHYTSPSYPTADGNSGCRSVSGLSMLTSLNTDDSSYGILVGYSLHDSDGGNRIHLQPRNDYQEYLTSHSICAHVKHNVQKTTFYMRRTYEVNSPKEHHEHEHASNCVVRFWDSVWARTTTCKPRLKYVPFKSMQ